MYRLNIFIPTQTHPRQYPRVVDLVDRPLNGGYRLQRRLGDPGALLGPAPLSEADNEGKPSLGGRVHSQGVYLTLREAICDKDADRKTYDEFHK